MIIRPVMSAAVQIDTARPIIQMRRIKQQHVKALGAHCDQSGRAAEQLLLCVDDLAGLHQFSERRIGRQQHFHSDAQFTQDFRNSTYHICQPAGFDKRRAFGGNEQDFHVTILAYQSSVS